MVVPPAICILAVLGLPVESFVTVTIKPLVTLAFLAYRSPSFLLRALDAELIPMVVMMHLRFALALTL